jgi:predicted dehydrogenase
VKNISRRDFLGTSISALGAASVLTGYGQAVAQSAPAALGANDRIRLGVIGVGGQGRHDLMTFWKHDPRIEVPIICDVDDAMIAAATNMFKDRKRPETVKDFRRVLDRKDIDAVLIATPDHWHALQTIHACQAGKDIYCEKPLANSIGEGKAMVDAARHTNRIVQMGTQWRMSRHHAEAVEFVQSGKLGKIRLVRCWCALDWFKNVGNPQDEAAPPPGVDYDLWLGPAPKRPFNRGRFHFSFRWFWDYAGGLMTDWGVHLLNIALWGMNVDFPKRVASVGGKYAFDDIAETPDTQNTLYDFGDFGLVWEHQAGTGHGAEKREHGCAFYGTNGTLIVDADSWEVAPEKGKGLEPITKKREDDPELCRVKLVGDFLNCCRTRKRPAEDLELGHHVTTVAHLGNLALRTGRSIEYDAANMRVIGNDKANEMITPHYRAPWTLPKL